MMEFIRSHDRYDAVDENGKTVAYIVKNYIGTHGHSSGWEHYVFCPELGKFVVNAYNGLDAGPWVFRSVKDFKEFYGGVNNG